MTDTAIMRIGPFGSYCRAPDDTSEKVAHPQSDHGFGTVYVRVPLALAEEYERHHSRCLEIEQEFHELAKKLVDP